MKFLKNVWSQLHRFVFWAIILSMLWCWIYTYVGDTSRDKKILVYVDVYAMERRALNLRLEEEGLSEGIKMIQVRSFDYDMFGSALEGDLYLMRESILKATLEESPEKLLPLTPPDGTVGYEWEGQIWGIQAFDITTQTGIAMEYLQYAPPPYPETENYYLCLDAQSPHLEDGAAWKVALDLLSLK